MAAAHATSLTRPASQSEWWAHQRAFALLVLACACLCLLVLACARVFVDLFVRLLACVYVLLAQLFDCFVHGLLSHGLLCRENILRWDLEETKAGGPFPQILDVDIFVNCIYLSKRIPPFVTRAMLDQEQRFGQRRRVRVRVRVRDEGKEGIVLF